MSRTRARAMRVEERGLKAVATTNTELIYLVEATYSILSKKNEVALVGRMETVVTEFKAVAQVCPFYPPSHPHLQ